MTPKAKTCLHCVRQLPMLRFGNRLYLMATTDDALRMRAVASVDFDRDALFAATICVETFPLAASGTTVRQCYMWRE